MLRGFIYECRILFRRGVLLAAIAILTISGTLPASALFGNDYPWPGASMNQYSPLQFYYRNCTDYVAWRINEARGGSTSNIKFDWGSLGFSSGQGDAKDWASAASARGYRVDGIPNLGAVAWWGTGDYGHVAIVGSISGDEDSIIVEEYNRAGDGKYGTRTISRGSTNWPQKFLHISDTILVRSIAARGGKDFNGDNKADIFWYGAGTAVDTMWYGTGAKGSFSTGVTANVSGTYTPISGDFNGDTYSDILWYGPGTDTDALWYGTSAKGTFDKEYDTNVGGTYTPIQ